MLMRQRTDGIYCSGKVLFQLGILMEQFETLAHELCIEALEVRGTL